MTMEIITAFITAPDENGCDVYSSYNLGEPAPICGCFESDAAPGCYFQFITADDFTKFVDAPGFSKADDGGKPEEEDDFCGGFKNEKQCEKKGGDGCLWGEDGCVVKGGLGIIPQVGGVMIVNPFNAVAATETVVGAGAVEQSNLGNGLDDMPLASAAMMLLSLYYALKW